MFRLVEDGYVTLSDGTPCQLSKVQLGDWLRGETSLNRVVGIRLILKDLPTFTTGRLPEFTVDQLIKVNEKWGAVAPSLVSDLYPDLSILALIDGLTIDFEGEGEPVELESCDRTTAKQFIEFELDGDHTFFLNGYLVHNKGGGASVPANTTQTVNPPKFLVPFLQDIAQKAQDAYGQVPQGGFTGDLVAGVDPRQQEALSMQESIARGLGSYGGDTNAIAQQQLNRVLSGDILAPANERFTPQSALNAGVYDAALDPIKRSLTEDIIPGIQSQAINQGAYGGTRQDVVQNQALRTYDETAQRTLTNLAAADFARTEDQRLQDLLSIRQYAPELEKINQAAALTVPELQNQALQQSLMGSSLLGEVGQAERLFSQDQLDNLYQQYVLATQTPFAGLDQYAGIIAGTPQGSVSTLSGGGTQSQSNPLMGAISGGLGGVSLGSALGLAPLGPAGIALGLGGLLLGGLFS